MTRGLHRARLNKYALGTALALTMAPFAGADRAEASCSPLSGQDNVTVTCTGTTTNQDGTNGYGQGTEQGVTVNVASGATVSGTDLGIAFKSNSTSVTTLNNLGTVTGAAGFSGSENMVVSNSGTISGSTDGVFGLSVLAATNSGTISGTTSGISASELTVTNLSTGTISGGGEALFIQNQADVTNAGTIQSLTGEAIRGLDTVRILSNSGTISGFTFGINAFLTANVTNASGGVIQATGAGGVAIGSSQGVLANAVTLANAGTVQALAANGFGVKAQTVNVTSNSGTISAAGTNGNAINATTTVNVTDNSGTISAAGTNGNAINATTVNVASNTGTITGDHAGVFATTANITNANTGKISSGNFGILANTGTVSNSGSIAGGLEAIFAASGNFNLTNASGGTLMGGNTGVFSQGFATISNAGSISGVQAGIVTNSTAIITNSGTITGKLGIDASAATTITNSGTIASTDGATGTAIKLSSAADTLNIKAGSNISGLIDMGHGADVINVDAAPSVAKGISMLSRATSAVVDALKLQLENFDGVINIVGGTSTSGQPTVTANGLTASVDPTALAQQDRTLMDFTGGNSLMVQSRLSSASGGASSGPMAMSYAPEDAHAQMFSKAPASSWNAPITVWSSMFGATRSQNGTDTTLNSNSNVFGGVIGVDRRIQPNWLVGAFAGGGSGSLNVDLSSQKINTDYASVGAYSRFEWGSQFFDTTLQGGSLNNRSDRLVQNNITGAGEHATASYNGWFISPEVAYGYRIRLADTLITPMLRVRYVAGIMDGYNESGSAQSLTVGSRTLQDFEERAEVEISRNSLFGDPSLHGWFRGGAIALQRVGDTTINAVLIGQSLSFVTPGKGSAVGGVGSVGFDYRVAPNVSVFGALEGMMMSDESRIGSARGGVKVAF